MLLTITTNHKPASDLSFLLHKHPDRVQEFSLSFGRVIVFYPDVSQETCSACLLLDIDPVGMVRRRRRDQSFFLGQYVNDRPYVASSFMSVAIAQVFGSALAGRCKDRPQLAETSIPLTVKIDVLPVRGDAEFVNRLFEPLGYAVDSERQPLDDQFPEWGDSHYYSVTLSATHTLSQVLTHLYVLIPVFDNSKHYFVGEDELEKLLSKGDGWLGRHPEKEQISRRYLRHQPGLFRQALARLVEDDPDPDSENDAAADSKEENLERMLSLNAQRYQSVGSVLKDSGAKRILDLGCGDGKLLRELMSVKQFSQITGVDVSLRSLEIAEKRLKLDRLPDRQAERVRLIHGSLMYRDQRFSGFDAAAVVEVIEHLDPPRLAAFERVLFEFARPKTVVMTTPNQEYNVMWESLPAGRFRHSDHRFEWTRQEFQTWADGVANQYGYTVRFLPIGPEDEAVGAPTQMGVFELVR